MLGENFGSNTNNKDPPNFDYEDAARKKISPLVGILKKYGPEIVYMFFFGYKAAEC